MTVPSVDTRGVIFVKSSHFHLCTHHRTELSTLHKPAQHVHSWTCCHGYTVFSVTDKGFKLPSVNATFSCSTACGVNIPWSHGSQAAVYQPPVAYRYPLKTAGKKKAQSVKPVLTWDINCSLQIHRGSVSSCAPPAWKKIAV